MTTTTLKKPTRNGLAFDTLAMSKRLRAVGVPEAQANEQVEIIAEVFEQNMATKKDIADVRKDMELMKADLQKEMHQMQSKIIIWVAAMLFAQAGFIAALQKLL